MNMIRSFIMVTTAISASTILYAQQPALKTGDSKLAASTVPGPGSKPVAAPELKPDNKNATLQSSAAVIIETPSPANRDQQMKAPQEKPKAVVVDDSRQSTTESLSTENLKTLNGTAEKPKQAAPLANDQAVKPLPVAAPAPAIKVKENL